MQICRFVNPKNVGSKKCVSKKMGVQQLICPLKFGQENIGPQNGRSKGEGVQKGFSIDSVLPNQNLSLESRTRRDQDVPSSSSGLIFSTA